MRTLIWKCDIKKSTAYNAKKHVSNDVVDHCQYNNCCPRKVGACDLLYLCGKKDWELNIRWLGRVSRTMCVLIFYFYVESREDEWRSYELRIL